MCVRDIQTSRLLLRPWSPGDADFLFDMESRWDVKRYVGAAPAVMTDRSEALASIERRRALNHPVYGIWAIELLSERVLVGNLLLKPIPLSVDDLPSPSEDVEIGWHLHPDYLGTRLRIRSRIRRTQPRPRCGAAASARRHGTGERGVPEGMLPSGHAAPGPDLHVLQRHSRGLRGTTRR